MHDVVGAVVGEWHVALEVDGRGHRFRLPVALAASGDAVATFTTPDGAVEWQVHVRQSPTAVSLTSTLTNHDTQPHRLGVVTLLAATHLDLGASSDAVAVLPVVPPGRQYCYAWDDAALPHLARTRLVAANTTRGIAVDLGFVTFQRCHTEIGFTGVGGAAGRASLDGVTATCDFAGWQLGAGESTTTEELRLAVGGDPYLLMEQWAETAAARVNPSIWNDAPIGYLGWSWTDTTNGAESYQDATLAVLDSINERLAGFGVDHLWTSMSNLAGSTPGRWLEWNDRCIPMGREAFLTAVTDRGFVPGLWIGPFYVSSALPALMERFADALLRDASGEPIVVCPEWRHGDAGLLPRAERPRLFALDPSHPEAQAYAREVFGAYREWGIRYYMVDFLEAGAGAVGRFPYAAHHDQSLVAGPEAYSAFLRAIREAAGDDTYLLSSTGPTHHNAGLVDGVRIGNDFGEGRPMSPEAFFYPASYVINGLDFETGPQYSLVNWGANFHTHRRLYLNDTGNVLTVDRPIPLSHARVAATIHAMGGGASMLGDDIRRITDERLQLIKKTLPRPRETARPLDLFTSLHPVGPRTFWRHVDNADGGYEVVALFNLGDEPWVTELDPAALGRGDADSLLVWDFWNEQFLGLHRGSFPVRIDPGSVRVLRLTPHRGRPTVIGTDMHVLMGEVELTDVGWEDEERTLTVEARRPAGERGTVFVWAPSDVRVVNFDGLHIAKEPQDNQLVIAIPFEFDASGTCRATVSFAGLHDILDMTTLDLA